MGADDPLSISGFFRFKSNTLFSTNLLAVQPGGQKALAGTLVQISVCAIFFGVMITKMRKNANTVDMVAMVVGECINFPIQRSFVFRSKGNIVYQGLWYLLAFCVITCIVNSVNCVWVAVAGQFVPDFVYNIGTVVLNGGISMVVFFFVNKIIFPEGEQKKEAA